MLRIIYITLIALFELGCAGLPPTPTLEQCTHSDRFDKFRCTNNKTGARRNVPRARLEGAQCLSLDDYREALAWIDEVKRQAERRCR